MGLSLYEIGAEVNIGGVIAKITAATVREKEKVTYEVVWWDGPIRHCQWIEECEIRVEPSRVQVGFRGAE